MSASEKNEYGYSFGERRMSIMNEIHDMRSASEKNEYGYSFGERRMPIMNEIHDMIGVNEGENRMKCYQVIFSPTGGTERVSAILMKVLSDDTKVIDLSRADVDFSKYVFRKEDVVLISVPSFAGRVPAVATEHLCQIKGNMARCILVCVYGNRDYDDTLAEMEDVAAACGFRITAAVAAIAEHSILHQYAAGRPDEKDREILDGFAVQIKEKIISGSEEKPKLPGNRPYRKAGSPGLVPKADKNCVSCGKCLRECPVQAIDERNMRAADAKKCISCMRCVMRCPRAARSVSGLKLAAAGKALKKACSVRKECELFI